MTPAHPDTPARSPNQGPGAKLAQARAEQRLTLEDVAATLHLAARQIQALEQDDFSSLPGTTYVRGYLKSYALLLGLSPAPILDAYARLTAKPATPDFSAIAPPREITSRHHQVRFVTYIMAAIVIGLALAWWQARETRPPSSLLAPTESASTGATPETSPTPSPSTESDKAQIVTSAPPAAPVATVTAVPPPVAATHAQPTTAPAIPAAVPPVAATPEPAGPRIKFVLRTEQESWADIRDARQVKLLYQTVPAGRTLTFEGVAPVSIFLGNAAGVHLDYNGQPVDITRYQRGMIARFTLGEEEADVVPAH